MSDGTMTWDQLVVEFETAMGAGPIDTSPAPNPCADPCPGDPTISCQLPSGHGGIHRAWDGLFEPERWHDWNHDEWRGGYGAIG